MKKKLLFDPPGIWGSKRLMIMRWLFIINVFCLLSVSANTHSQKQKFSLSLKKAQLADVFNAIEEQSELSFIYHEDKTKLNYERDVDFTNATLDEILGHLLSNTGFDYKLMGNYVAIIKSEIRENEIQQAETVVKGKVIDIAGEPLPGVNVYDRSNPGTGVITGVDGSYELKVTGDDVVITYSFIGFVTQDIQVGDRTTINITMVEDAIGLDEVVAIGYGVEQVRNVTGAVANVSAEDMENIPASTVIEKMQGQMAGVRINQGSGMPGTGASIRIRGAASINATNKPLYVVDGFPITGDINSIAPDQIEDISVLKGAAASSLYGSRAANGVVLVTTKQAKANTGVQLEVALKSGVGIVPENMKPNVCNAKQFVQHMNMFWEDRVKYQGASPDDIPAIFANPAAYNGPNTNWYDELLRNQKYTDVAITLSNGGEKARTSNMLSYFKEDGAVINSKYQRISARSNNIYDVNEHLRFGVSVSPSYEFGDRPKTDGGSAAFWNTITMPPIFDPNEVDENGDRIAKFEGDHAPIWNLPNPKKRILEETREFNFFKLVSNAYAEVKFAKYFTAKTALANELKYYQWRSYSPSTIGKYAWSSVPRIADAYEERNQGTNWTWENSLLFEKTFAEDHNVKALLVYSAMEDNWNQLKASGNTFANDQITYVGAATNKDANTGVSDYALVSTLGRLNYNYKEKYLLTAAVRRDGASRFGSEQRWGTFPSVSLAWIISNEGFMDNLDAISFLKLRAEHGKTGNWDIGNYKHIAGTGVENYFIGGAVVEGRRINGIGNQGLTWETSVGSGIGLDLGLLNDRITFTADYYRKNTDGLLYQVDIPKASGYSNIQSNIGEFKFWGYEFSASSRNLTGKLKWNTNFNISFDRNEVIKLGTNNVPLDANHVNAGSRITAVGHPIGQYYGYIFDGIYDNQEELDNSPKRDDSAVGSVKFKDLDGDGKISMGAANNGDLTYIGDPNPDFTFGMTNTFQYKNWDLGITMVGSYGADLWYGIYEWTGLLEGLFNVDPMILDRWRSPENPGSGRVPNTTQPQGFRDSYDAWITDGSYLSIKNVTLGYDIPKKIGFIKNARIYGTVANLHTFTNYPGGNPEASDLSNRNAGSEAGTYPLSRTYVLGLNVTF